MADEFDKGCRVLAKSGGAEFVAWLFGISREGTGFVGWLDARRVRFPNEPDRTCDTLARLHDPADNGRPWAVAIEFQSTPDPDMTARMMGYLAGVLLSERPTQHAGDRFEVGGVIVNLTGRGNASRDLKFGERGLPRIRMDYLEWNLEHEQADATLDGIAAGGVPMEVLPFVALMQGGGEVDIIGRWKELASAVPDARWRGTLGAFAGLFAELQDRHEIWRKELEGWNVRESKVVNAWRDEGRAEGRIEGRAEGRAEESKAMLAEFLRARFGELPSDFDAALRGVSDLGRLRTLIPTAATATSLAEFRQEAGL